MTARIGGAFFAIACIILGSLAAPSAAAAATIKVGVILTYSGPNAEPSELITIRKICSGVTVTRTNTVEYTAGTPPERRFQLAP